MNVLILGGGAQGRVIAADLAAASPQAKVSVADVRKPALPALPNLSWIEADLSDTNAVIRLLASHDLAVGALPARLGFQVMRAAIEAKRPMVDVSFSEEGPLDLDADARKAGIALVPDCGLAPGMSHLLVGRAVQRYGKPREITILVGGVAVDKTRPYGYVVTGSLEDLVAEYTRPARIVRDGKPISVPALSGLENVTIDGAGTMERFYSDGLRTLLRTLPGVPDMREMTLRWPGHVEQVIPLMRDGTLVEVFRRECVVDPPEDLVAMEVSGTWADGTSRRWTLIDRYDPVTKMTAMARTTALTTAAAARLGAERGLGRPGVRPLELVAEDIDAADFILGALAERGIRVREPVETKA